MARAELQKRYDYKMYTPAGVYLGLLPNVISDFNYNMMIATAFAQMQITVAQSADVAVLANEALMDETGTPITDESGNNILIERQPDIVGASNSTALIANNNLVKVYEYSNYYPNGTLVFSGYVSKWKTVFGADDDIVITCISQGQDLNNYIVSSGDTSFVSQATDDGSTVAGIGNINLKAGEFSCAVQTFTVPSNASIGGVTVEVATPEAGYISVSIFQQVGFAPDPKSDVGIVGGSVYLGVTSKTAQKISFSSYPTLNTGLTYYILASWNPDSGNLSAATFYLNGTNPYAGGNYWYLDFNGVSWGQTPYTAVDMYFVIWQHGGSVVGTYTSVDPSFMLTDVMSNYTSQGGFIGVGSGYSNTGVITSYTFKLQSVLQAIQAIMQLAPSTWYWYVDPTTSRLVFAQASTTADLTIIKGRHIDELDIEATKENIKNVAYFTGGDDGTGTNKNILVKVQSTQGSNRIGLAQLSDNRVNSTNGGTVTARLIAQNYLNQNASETYITTVTIQDQTVDINLFKLGMMVGFSGFGNFVDGLLLQVVGVNRAPDQLQLQLGSLPVRQSQAVIGVQQQITAVQTVDIPTIPS